MDTKYGTRPGMEAVAPKWGGWRVEVSGFDAMRPSDAPVSYTVTRYDRANKVRQVGRTFSDWTLACRAMDRLNLAAERGVAQ